jgi:zinc D-Ala-D-Ala carboxypeptidase
MAGRLSAAYRLRLREVWRELGIDEAVVGARRLPLHAEAQRLRPVGLGSDGRDRLLVDGAAQAWAALRAAAQAEGLALQLVSAFRSVDFQAALIRNKRAKGRTIDEILTVNAPPGCSEHHTGRAVDIGVPDCPPLEEDFERTPAFAWLQTHAAHYGFSLSYPRDNAEGYPYEPWHWCWRRAGRLKR